MPVHRTAPSRSLPLHPAMSQASTERSREVERERSREVERGPHTHTHTHTHTMGNIPRSQGGFGSCQMATTTQQGERLPLSACSQRLSNRVPCSVLKGCRTKLTCSVLLSFFCFAADSAELQGHTRYLMCVAATPPTPDFPQGQHLSQLPVHLLVFPHPFCMVPQSALRPAGQLTLRTPTLKGRTPSRCALFFRGLVSGCRHRIGDDLAIQRHVAGERLPVDIITK